MRTIPVLILSSALLISCASNPKNNKPSIISVIWLDEDGTILQKEKCNKEEANSLQYIGDTPKKQKTSQYTYYFNGWSNPAEQDNGDIVYTATYREEINKYTVIWKNYDGTVLETDYDVPYGATPSFDGNDPVRARDVQYTYSFREWAPSVHSVTGDAIYTANYNTSLNYYYFYLDPNSGECDTESLCIGYGQNYSLPTPTKAGYTFLGWYDGSTKVAQSSKWTYSTNKNLVAKWTITNYSISYALNGGTNSSSNPSSYTIESNTISLRNPTRTGYTFLGWFDGNNGLVTSIASGSTGNIELNARWNDGNAYSVTLDPNNGSVSNTSIDVQYDHSYTLPIPTRLGYSFDGWFNGSTQINNSGTWKYTSNMSFVARWTIVNYSINYTLNDGINSSSNPSTYTVLDSITFSAPSKTGYSFDGWFDDDNNQVTSITVGSTGSLSIEARWSSNLNNLSITSEDTSKGTVSIAFGSGYSGESITVVAAPSDDCVFKGWYCDFNKVSDNEIYTFTMPTNDYSLIAKFYTIAEQLQEEWDIAHGVIPTISDEDKTLTYGLYPQTNINDPELISSLNALTTPESNGWYLFDNEYYAKYNASPDSTGYTFDNGTTIVSGVDYWFKCEPIVWNILTNSNGNYFVLSKFLLDTGCYSSSSSGRAIDGKTVWPNNYEYSDIREWLNNDFYNSSFALGDAHIQTTVVDNSKETLDSTSNPYSCNNTQDKVFLLSYKDYTNSNYGFSNSAARKCKTTDWARARGAFISTGTNSLYNGIYWTRSPDNKKTTYSGMPEYAWEILSSGSFLSFGDSVRSNYVAVRPSIVVTV